MERARDRISELPDTVRLHIISLLPRKFAIRTSVLSNRWKNLWRYRWPYPTVLDFGKEFAEGLTQDKLVSIDLGKEFTEVLTQEKLVSNVDQVLRLHSNKKIEIFKLFFYPGTQYRSNATAWIESIVMSQVEELSLDMSQGYLNNFTGRLAHGRRAFQFPSCLFNAESLSLFSLKHCELLDPLEFRRLQFLETLCFTNVNVTDDMVIDVMTSCPLLERLDLRLCIELSSIKIAAENLRLKRLIVIDCWKAHEIEIFAPNLHSFHFNGELLQRYLLNVPLLSDAIMSSAGRQVGSRQPDWADIVANLANVRVLTLCCRAVQQIALVKDPKPLVLPNLQELQFQMELMTETNLSDIRSFFRRCQCPNLEKLFIELPMGAKDPSVRIFLELSEEDHLAIDFTNLRIIKMSRFKGHKNEIELVRFLIEKAAALESMILVTCEDALCTEDVGHIEMDPIHWLRYVTRMPVKFLHKASPNARLTIRPYSTEDNYICSMHHYIADEH